MLEWKEVTEEGQVFWVHDELGNVMKLGDNIFIAMMPKVIKLGPFSSAEQAKEVLENHTKGVDQVLEHLNHNLLTIYNADKKSQ